MARRTWITVKRGILEPKHRFALGELIWLFMYILDITNWEAGTIEEWSDKGVADEMDMPLPTLIDQRRKLQEKGYITCERKQHGIRVIVHNWTNPREYTGKKYNEKVPSDTPINTPVNTLVNTPSDTPINTPIIKNTARNILPSFNQKSQITSQKNNNDDISFFAKIAGIPHEPKNLSTILEWRRNIDFLYSSGATDEVLTRACKNIRDAGGLISGPESIIAECAKILRSKKSPIEITTG